MWYKNLNRHWNKAKSFIKQGYNTIGKWAGEADRAAGIGKRIFSLATPILNDIGGGDIIKSGVNAIGEYDKFRSQVSNVNQKALGYGRDIDQANIF